MPKAVKHTDVREPDPETGITVRQIVIWRLPEPVPPCTHRFKYRMYYGGTDGVCRVRFDNERGKGDHCHVDGLEFVHTFVAIELTRTDFDNAVADWSPSS